MKFKTSLLDNEDRSLFRLLLAVGLLIALFGLTAPNIWPGDDKKIFFLLVGMSGIVLIAIQMARMTERIWGLEAARAAMKLKEQEEKARVAWGKLAMKKSEFADLSLVKQTVLVIFWVIGIVCFLWAIAAGFGLEFTRPSAGFTDVMLKNDPVKILVDRIAMTTIFGIIGIMCMVTGHEMFRAHWEEKPDDDGWDDIVFVTDKSNIVH